MLAWISTFVAPRKGGPSKAPAAVRPPPTPCKRRPRKRWSLWNIINRDAMSVSSRHMKDDLQWMCIATRTICAFNHPSTSFVRKALVHNLVLFNVSRWIKQLRQQPCWGKQCACVHFDVLSQLWHVQRLRAVGFALGLINLQLSVNNRCCGTRRTYINTKPIINIIKAVSFTTLSRWVGVNAPRQSNKSCCSSKFDFNGLSSWMILAL